MEKLWQLNSTNDNGIAQAVEQFTVGDDYLLDWRLVPYDIRASKAHAKGLHKIDLLTGEELESLLGALDLLLEQWQKGEFQVKRQQEDCHTAIEQFLVKKLGDAGKKIHTGRSRNDQVLAAMRLYQKNELENTAAMIKQTAGMLLKKASEYAWVPMPGYTHTQPAMPSSVGLWLGSIAEMLIMDLEGIRGAYVNADRCPLGTAAGFGTAFDLPRKFVAGELGFSKLLTVSLAAQNSRGKIDLQVVQALEAAGATLAHFAGDLLCYTGREFDYFELPGDFRTGSSIMPQKRNLDPAELVRGKYGVLCGYSQSVKMIAAKLNSGYHRDFQLFKKHVMAAFDDLGEMLQMTLLLVKHLEPKEGRLEEAAGNPELYAADRANELVAGGVPFREAYTRVKQQGESTEAPDPVENIRSKRHIGAPGNLGLEQLRGQLDDFTLGS